jgi:hypothetical protein
MNHSKCTFAAALFALLALSGCYSEPTATDIETTVRQLHGKTLLSAIVPILGVKKLGCTSAKGAPGYHCDVEMETSIVGSRTKTVARMRFAKNNDGWTLIQ